MKVKQSKKNNNSRKKPPTRKQLRKEMRKQKKVRNNDYYSRRNNTLPSEDETHLNVNKNKKPKKSEDPQIVMRKKEQMVQKLLEKQMRTQRRETLKKANVDEDKIIKTLEKKLHLNKRKAKGIASTFVNDGLDYLLEVCDSDNLKATVASEQQFAEVNDEFEEDFALMTGQSVAKKKETIESDADNSSESGDDALMEENEDSDAFDEDFDEESGEEDQISLKRKNDNEHVKEGSGKKMKVYADSSECSLSENEREEEDKEEKDTWEDIYGRIRAKDGTIITNNEQKYLPPAMRAKLEANSTVDKKRLEKLNRLKRQLKGNLNRLAESNMHSITSEIESLYMNNSRNDMNETLCDLIWDALLSTVLTPERLLLEHVLLISILHANIGTEIGAHFLQVIVRKFNELFNSLIMSAENKMVENAVNIIGQLYNFKVVHHALVYEILEKLYQRFNESDVECILLLLKNIGFSLRKDDPLALKNLILNLQKRANDQVHTTNDNPRVKFMLDILLAIKNNNVAKIPNYDTSYAEHLKKISKGLIRQGCYVTTLNITLEDLLKADERGKWWVVGSAWSGKTEQSEKQSNPTLPGFTVKLLQLARKQRMNTDTRRDIFCIMMSAEDYLDAFDKLVRLDLKNQQQREIIHVLLHCCLQEKTFNKYYAILAQKFCEYDRKFQMTIKCSIWDKLKAITEISSSQLSNLAKLLTHLFLEKALPISTLKIVQFGDLDKITLRFIRQILIGILLFEDEEVCLGVFEKVAQSDKLKMFKESLRLFVQHFLLRNLKENLIERKDLLENRAQAVDKLLSFSKKKLHF